MTRFVAALFAGAIAVATGFASPGPRATVSVFASFESDGQRPPQPLVPTREHLSVLLDGKPVVVESVSPVNVRASILLLVDLTWTTTRGHHPAQAADVAHLKIDLPSIASVGHPMLFPGLVRGLDKAFLPLLAPGDDLHVGSFAGQHLSFRRAVSASPLDRLSAFKEVVSADVVSLADWYGPARIWDAVAAGAARFSDDSPFKSIVLVTDGQSSGNRLGHAEAIMAAVAHGVVVHVVCQKSWWDPSIAPPGETFVKRLADETGDSSASMMLSSETRGTSPCAFSGTSRMRSATRTRSGWT